jgi:hypothetical protein
MHIDKFRKEDGHYETEDGYWYANAVDLLGSYCGFCGCGDPESVLKLVRDALGLLYDQFPVDGPSNPQEWTIHFKNWRLKELAIFGTHDLALFFWYWADDKKFTDHGTAVPGWLTVRGRELLEDLLEMNLGEEVDAKIP